MGVCDFSVAWKSTSEMNPELQIENRVSIALGEMKYVASATNVIKSGGTKADKKAPNSGVRYLTTKVRRDEAVRPPWHPHVSRSKPWR
tara:strand:+ start:106 stop:369 length:264 start_codon:yes stop_codon:yes gene_type:complete